MLGDTAIPRVKSSAENRPTGCKKEYERLMGEIERLSD